MRPLLLLLFATAACNNFINSAVPPPPPAGSPTLQQVDTFSYPVYLTAPPGDSSRLFVVEQGGRVKVLHNDTTRARPFLDLRGKISSGGERGLLSLAFHPQYASNGRFYVYFTNPSGNIRIVRYNVSTTDPDSADPATADTVLRVAHPTYDNHNGGQLQFGPDGKLYAGIGDGGSGGDPNGNGQNKHVLLAKLLRLDVDGASGYTIPADNPFATDTSGAPEIWAYGLRNPWRFSFDKSTGDLFIADVGQDTWEEVDVGEAGAGQGKGLNYGWNNMEGFHCYPPDPNDACSRGGFTLPVAAYAHANGACSITGGYVYRGSKVALLKGYYLFADYCAGTVRAFKYLGGSSISAPLNLTEVLSPGSLVSSFGQDEKGDVYIMTLNGTVFRIVAAP
ncbi:MAG TPA: PQQ-dependent sugar dehydrogenase [Gemmatimonadales bacterium]|nr:PQQ-dependent sugar dehydrogenase [Gemmatimonadales bacterium]